MARDTVGETDAFFLDKSTTLLPLAIWGDLLHLCPIAAHTPFDLSVDAKETLRLGSLFCEFAPDDSEYNVIRCMKPIWSVDYAACTSDMYGQSTKHRAPPFDAQYRRVLPRCVKTDVTRSTKTIIYELKARHYSDGGTEGTLYIISTWLDELYTAVLDGNTERFWDLIDLEKKWEGEGRTTLGGTE
ncbi:hypothetical protein Ptr902_06192 [Pyrenophora tritici-repentis]|nr:hypothetical protein Ptr902_06192 [Pyrenophora tritici-repentis]